MAWEESGLGTANSAVGPAEGLSQGDRAQCPLCRLLAGGVWIP